MQDLQINLYLFLAVVELAAVLAGTTAFFWWRSKKQQKKPASLDNKESNSYARSLETEIAYTQELIEVIEQEEKPDMEKFNALTSRLKYLQLELDLQAHDRGTELWQAALQDGIGTLFPDPGGAGEGEEAPATLAGFDQLREIINSQATAVDEISQNLDEKQSDIEGYDEIQTILKTYETQHEELLRCVDMLEKAAAQGAEDDLENDSSEDKESLLTMVNNQQATIDSLRTLFVNLPADDNLPALEKALDSIQQNNRELNDCVTVLEGENERLRDKLEKITSGETDVEQEDVDTLDEKAAEKTEDHVDQKSSEDKKEPA